MNWFDAAKVGDADALRRLLAEGAEVDARDERGWSALAYAVYDVERKQGYPEVVQALIEAGADFEATIGYGVRPLMLAAGYGEADVVAVLLNAGADPLAKNEGGYTALAMAKQKPNIDVINMLHEAEMMAGIGEGSCGSRTQSGVNVVNFMPRPGK